MRAVTPWRELDDKELQVRLVQKNNELFEAEKPIQLT